MHAAVRIELLGVDRVEALRRLAVAFLQLRTEPSRPKADRVGGEMLVAAVLLHPDLELVLELEDADINRSTHSHAKTGEPLVDAREVWRAGQRLPGAETGLVVGAGQIDAPAVDQLPPIRRQRVDADARKSDDEQQSDELAHWLKPVTEPRSVASV